MPWIKMDHADVVVPQPATCGVCGTYVDAETTHCSNGACPYPYPAPPAVEKAAPEGVASEEVTGEQPPADVAPATGEPQPA